MSSAGLRCGFRPRQIFHEIIFECIYEDNFLYEQRNNFNTKTKKSEHL